MMGQSPDRRDDDLSRHRDRIRSQEAPLALAAAEEGHMTKALTARAGSLSRVHPLLFPFLILPFNNDNTKKSRPHTCLRAHMRKSDAGSAPGQRRADTTRSHSTRNDGRKLAMRPIDPRVVL